MVSLIMRKSTGGISRGGKNREHSGGKGGKESQDEKSGKDGRGNQSGRDGKKRIQYLQ